MYSVDILSKAFINLSDFLSSQDDAGWEILFCKLSEWKPSRYSGHSLCSVQKFLQIYAHHLQPASLHGQVRHCDFNLVLFKIYLIVLNAQKSRNDMYHYVCGCAHAFMTCQPRWWNLWMNRWWPPKLTADEWSLNGFLMSACLLPRVCWEGTLKPVGFAWLWCSLIQDLHRSMLQMFMFADFRCSLYGVLGAVFETWPMFKVT